ncbi:MAG: hypothetical protein E6R03_17015 [Hyphomicrobiaceae bacterium]|nr:MAG: hypothetical protein E6R03_17015 [Hyphomicrobiaceae bacterium]
MRVIEASKRPQIVRDLQGRILGIFDELIQKRETSDWLISQLRERVWDQDQCKRLTHEDRARLSGYRQALDDNLYRSGLVRYGWFIEAKFYTSVTEIPAPWWGEYTTPDRRVAQSAALEQFSAHYWQHPVNGDRFTNARTTHENDSNE